MIYKHAVNRNGIYYNAGEDVPDDVEDKGGPDLSDLPFNDTEIQMETSPHKYTYEELSGISVRKIKELAENLGFTISKVIKDDVINEFLSQQV